MTSSSLGRRWWRCPLQWPPSASSHSLTPPVLPHTSIIPPSRPYRCLHLQPAPSEPDTAESQLSSLLDQHTVHLHPVQSGHPLRLPLPFPLSSVVAPLLTSLHCWLCSVPRWPQPRAQSLCGCEPLLPAVDAAALCVPLAPCSAAVRQRQPSAGLRCLPHTRPRRPPPVHRPRSATLSSRALHSIPHPLRSPSLLLPPLCWQMCWRRSTACHLVLQLSARPLCSRCCSQSARSFARSASSASSHTQPLGRTSSLSTMKRWALISQM